MRNTNRLTILLLIFAISLSACITTATPTEDTNQVQNTPVDIQAQVDTAVAQTIDTQNQVGTSVAQTLQAQVTLTPTATETPVPTLTPVFIPSPTNVPSSGGGGGGSKPQPTPSKYNCTVTYEKPGDGTVFKPNKEFDITWTVKNTGTIKWDATWMFSFFTGTNYSSTPAYPLGVNVAPGESIVLRLDATSPSEGVTYDHPVTFLMQWAIQGDGVRFCKPYKAIIVSFE